MKWLNRLIRSLWVLSLLAFLLTSIAYIACHAMVPMSRDQWHMLYSYYHNGVLKSSLTAVSAHHHILAFLLYDVDLRWFRGSNGFLILVDQLLNLALLALLGGALWRHTAAGFARWLLLAWTVMLPCWLLNIALLGWGFNGINNYLGLLPALLAIACLQRARTHGAAWRWLALAAGLLATYSFGNGFLVWPIAVLCLYLWRAPWREPVAVSAVGLLAVVGYFVLPGSGEVSSSIKVDLLQLVKFPAQLMGGPLYHLLRALRVFGESTLVMIASTVGTLIWLAALYQLLAVIRRRDVDALWPSLCVALLCFGAGTTVLLTFTRGDTALDPWVDRYQIWALLVWLGTSHLVYQRASAVMRRGWHVLILLFPLAALPSQLDWGARLAEYGVRVNKALLSYAIYLPVQSDAEKALHFSWTWKLPYFFDVFEHLRVEQRNVFRAATMNWYGRQWTAPLNLQPCSLADVSSNAVKGSELLPLSLMPDVERYPASAKYRLMPVNSEQIVAQQLDARIENLLWDSGVVLDERNVVRGLVISLSRSLLPRANGLRVGGDVNLYAIWRRDGETPDARYRLVLFDADRPRCQSPLVTVGL